MRTTKAQLAAIGTGLLASGAVALALGTSAEAQPAATDAQDRCAAFADAEIRAGLTITSAHHVPEAAPGTVPAGPGMTIPVAVPAHCVVEGVIDPHTGADGARYGIGFQLALPDEWNGRFLLQGGGGLNGSVRPALGPTAAGDRPALTRGFAVISHDSGHKGAGFDDSFMSDQRAALNFAEASVRTVALDGKRMTELYYGRDIDHSYMTGCSTGGREGMLASQRYPELFDGIIVGAPAMRTGHSNLGIEYSTVQFNQASPRGEDGLPILSQALSSSDRKTILGGLLNQCDALDGRADGMIMNVAGCNFRPEELQCTGEKRDGCLSAEQVGAIERSFAGPRDAAGYPVYAPVPYDTGIVFTGGPGLPGYLPTGAPGVFGPPSPDLTIDIDARLRQIEADAPQRLTDTNVWTDLDTFLGHGGKILFFHGVSDPWFSAFDTWDYWQRAAETNGTAFTDASRFYMNPGMGHCQGGNAFDSFDLLGPLVDLVENGKPVEMVVASRADGSEKRPLCPHPSYAHYNGGEPAKADSYSCRMPDS